MVYIGHACADAEELKELINEFSLLLADEADKMYEVVEQREFMEQHEVMERHEAVVENCSTCRFAMYNSGVPCPPHKVNKCQPMNGAWEFVNWKPTQETVR